MKKIKLNRKILMAAAVLAVAVIAGIYFSRVNDLPVVETAEALEQRDLILAEEEGTVHSPDKQVVFTGTGGILESLTAEPGSAVLKGEVLGYLDTADAMRNAYESALASREAAYAHTELVLGDNPDYAGLKAAALQAESSYESARKSFLEGEALYASGGISENEYRLRQDALAVAEESMKSAAAYAGTANMTLLEKSALAELAAAESLLFSTGKSLDEAVFTAEADGKVLDVAYRPGDYIAPGSTVMTLAGSGEKEIEVLVLADLVRNLRAGQKVRISGDVLGDGVELEGTLKSVAAAAELNYSLLGAEEYRVRCIISTSGHENLLTGSQVDVEIHEEMSGVFVPLDALFRLDGSDALFVFENSRAVLKNVVKDIEGKDWALISEGIVPGEDVVLNPPDELEDGMKIKEEE